MSTRITALTLISLMLGTAFAQDQQAIREQLFAETDAVKAEADALNAVMLAPESYAEGLELYLAAGDELARGRDLERVREGLDEARALFSRAVDAATLAQTTFTNALAARAQAQEAEAEIHAEREWTRAEESLIEAAKTLEGGNLNRASDTAGDALERYEDAAAEALAARARADN